MLIDTHNIASLCMANSLNYDVFQRWNFYSSTLKETLQSTSVKYEHSKINHELILNYVDSWRWFPFDKESTKDSL